MEDRINFDFNEILINLEVVKNGSVQDSVSALDNS